MVSSRFAVVFCTCCLCSLVSNHVIFQPLTSNHRRYDSFVNYDFFPSIQLPILVYFKETQTPKDMQIKGSLGSQQMDRRDNGQMHWFPAFANARQLKEQFEAHRCKKIRTVNGEEFTK